MSYTIENGIAEQLSISSSLHLDSLTIEQFRAFPYLHLAELGRVNLIVGKNSVGKTCLLEAIVLYAERGSPTTIVQILEGRDEIAPSLTRSTYNSLANVDEEDTKYPPVNYLFFGRKELTEQQNSIRIGPGSNNLSTLALTLNWFAEESIADQLGPLRKVDVQASRIESTDSEIAVPILPGITVEFNATTVTYLLDQRFARRRLDVQPNLRKIPNVYVRPHSLDLATISRLWDKITLTDLEKDVIEAVRIIAPTVEAINTKGDRQRIVQARLTGIAKPLPLRSLGEGINRILGIILALVNAQNGILLVDEVESGLHYSVQFALWRLIFQVAQRLNVQIFATTHSWDCVEAFQQAATEARGEEGMLIRLQRKKDEIIPTLFNEHRLAIATREQIEIR